MNIWKKFFGKKNESRNLINSHSQQKTKSKSYVQGESFAEACLKLNYQELDDKRWFSHFKELPEIDKLRKEGKTQKALSLCLKGLESYPDSFLFYGRAADIYDDLGKTKEAEDILMEGLTKSLSKCSLSRALGDRAFSEGNYRKAIYWWIQSGVMQLESRIMVDMMPFLKLAYICHPLRLVKAEKFLLQMADIASNEGPIRFTAEGAELLHQIGRSLMESGDTEALTAIQQFYHKYR